ncbi:MAG: MBL fold metallo-hydrolase [Phycisphaerales bacterium]|nr:MBL fold metallo-hydrolase [Phycisphaerales bacterium]
MNLHLLGTGCPAVDIHRYGPASLVQNADGARVLVDCGSGVTQRLLSAGTSGAEVDLLLLTHLHSDHVVDLFQFIISSWHQGRDRGHQVVGPAGTQEFVGQLLEVWRPELERRVMHEKRPSIDGLDVEITEIGHGAEMELGDMVIEAFEVDHRPMVPAMGFSFRENDHHIVLSGDTGPCEMLIEAAMGCDVLVHDVLLKHEMQPREGVRSQETIDQVASYHATAEQVGRIATEAEAKCLILTHFVPPIFDEAKLLEIVRADYDGPVLCGEDLMLIDPANPADAMVARADEAR